MTGQLLIGQTEQLVPVIRSVAVVSHLSSANMPRIVKWLNCTVFFLETAAVWHLAGKLGFLTDMFKHF